MARPSRGADERRGRSFNGNRELRPRGRRTRERLLDAGAKVFAERGYHAARVDDVVKAARTSHGTFYLYFSSKEHLFSELATGVAEAMVDLARELPVLPARGAAGANGDASADAYAALHAWLSQFSDLYARNAAVIRAWTEAEIVDSDMGKIGGTLVVQFSRELAERLHSAMADLDAGIAGLALVGMVERANYYLASRQLRAVGATEMVDTLARVMHAALYGGVPASTVDGHPAIFLTPSSGHEG